MNDDGREVLTERDGRLPDGTGLVGLRPEPASSLGHTATIPSADLLYLVKLADWCAGEGFCQIEGIEDPDEWCFRMWSRLGPENGDGYSAEALAQGMAARSGETVGLDPKGNSPVVADDAPDLQDSGCTQGVES